MVAFATHKERNLRLLVSSFYSPSNGKLLGSLKFQSEHRLESLRQAVMF
jgi:hypothetical protein